MSDGCIRLFMDEYPNVPPIEPTNDLVDTYQPPTTSLVRESYTNMSWDETINIIMTNIGK